MPKTADEKMEGMERSIRQYRWLVVVLILLLMVTHRHTIVGWIDSASGWVEGVKQVSAEPVRGEDRDR